MFSQPLVARGNPMQRLPFIRHVTASKLRHRYVSCRHPVEKTRWHALWLLARTDVPRTPAQVADLVGLSAVTVRDVLHRWNADGPAGVADRRRNNGAAPKLAARQRQALLAALHKRPPDGGLWTGPQGGWDGGEPWRVAVDPPTGWRWLRDLGFTLQVPRPSHPRSATPSARRAWKKTCGAGSDD